MSHSVLRGIPDSFEVQHFCWARDKWLSKCTGQVSQSIQAAVTKIPQTGWLKQQIIISHISIGWEVQNQGDRFNVWLELASMTIFSLCCHVVEGVLWSVSLSLSLSAPNPSALFSIIHHASILLCIQHPVETLYKGTNPIRGVLLPHDLANLQTPHLQLSSYLFHRVHLGRDANIQSAAGG